MAADKKGRQMIYVADANKWVEVREVPAGEFKAWWVNPKTQIASRPVENMEVFRDKKAAEAALDQAAVDRGWVSLWFHQWLANGAIRLSDETQIEVEIGLNRDERLQVAMEQQKLMDEQAMDDLDLDSLKKEFKNRAEAREQEIRKLKTVIQTGRRRQFASGTWERDIDDLVMVFVTTEKSPRALRYRTMTDEERQLDLLKDDTAPTEQPTAEKPAEAKADTKKDGGSPAATKENT